MNTYDKMTKTPVQTLVIELSIPTIISMLISNIYNMADTYFVSSLGTSASGATGIVFAILSIFQAFGFMFGHGAGSHISRALGRKDKDSARRFASTSFYSSIVFGIFVCILGLLHLDAFMTLLGSTPTILPYSRIYGFFILLAGPGLAVSCVMNNILRYEGKAFYAMVGLTSGGLLNILGDALFIRGFSMGIYGAGLSTMISQYVSCFILFLPYLQNKTESTFFIRDFDIHKLASIIAVGLPSLARQGLMATSTTVLNICAHPFGDVAISAFSIVNRIMNFLFCIIIGLGQGFQPVSAFNYGAKLYTRVKEGLLFSIKLGTIVMIVIGVIGYIFSSSFVSLFISDSAVIEIGQEAMRYQCVTLVLVPLVTMGNMLFQSIGKSRIALFLAMLKAGLLFIPLCVVLSSNFGLPGMMWAQPLSDILSLFITLPFVVSFIIKL